MKKIAAWVLSALLVLGLPPLPSASGETAEAGKPHDLAHPDSCPGWFCVSQPPLQTPK